MAEQHRATADDWALIERMLHVVEFSCLLELRDRIEALENDRRAILNSSSRLRVGLEAAQPAKSSHPAKPDSSLVERVADAIVVKATSAGIVNDRPARAAIREVAAWLREQKVYGVGWVWAVERLEEEAER